METKHSTTKPQIPEGQMSIEAMLVSDDTAGDKISGTMTKDSTGSFSDILNGKLTVSIITKDPQTEEIIRLDNVPVKLTIAQNVTGFTPAQPMILHVPSYKSYRMKSVEGMYAVPKADDPVIQNQAIPTPVKIKDNVESFSNSPSPTCKKFNEAQDKAKRHLGLTMDRDDVTIFQGKKNGKSPGMLVHQQDGKIYMFDSSSKQYMAMGSDGIQMKGSTLDIGDMDVDRSTYAYVGLPQKENKVNDVVPQGTILTPQPKTIPNVAKILNTIGNIMDMVDLITCCSDAVTEIHNGGSGNKAANKAKESSFQNAMMEGRTDNNGDPYKRG